MILHFLLSWQNGRSCTNILLTLLNVRSAIFLYPSRHSSSLSIKVMLNMHFSYLFPTMKGVCSVGLKLMVAVLHIRQCHSLFIKVHFTAAFTLGVQIQLLYSNNKYGPLWWALANIPATKQWRTQAAESGIIIRFFRDYCLLYESRL